MDATVPLGTTVSNGKNLIGDKPVTSRRHVVVIATAVELREIATLVVHHSKNGNTNYASFWLHDRASNTHLSGFGRATGWGYHRPSAAAADAFESAGIAVSDEIAGRGDGAVNEALRAIVRACGYPCPFIVGVS